jgi:hypothetical protein
MTGHTHNVSKYLTEFTVSLNMKATTTVMYVITDHTVTFKDPDPLPHNVQGCLLSSNDNCANLITCQCETLPYYSTEGSVLTVSSHHLNTKRFLLISSLCHQHISLIIIYSLIFIKNQFIKKNPETT